MLLQGKVKYAEIDPYPHEIRDINHQLLQHDRRRGPT
jgi:hypothetical protein